MGHINFMLEDFKHLLDVGYEDNRIDWDDVFSLFITILSYRSSCAKTKQACVLVKDTRIIGLGYNGPRSGGLNCLQDGGEEACGKDLSGSCLNAIHAEQNCIGYAVRNGISTEGCSMYVTMTPCISCAKLIIASGIKEYVYLEEYRLTEGVDFLRNNNIIVRKLS